MKTVYKKGGQVGTALLYNMCQKKVAATDVLNLNSNYCNRKRFLVKTVCQPNINRYISIFYY